MKPQEQERVQRRMQAWAKLTPRAAPPGARELQAHRQGAAGEARTAARRLGRIPGAAAAKSAQSLASADRAAGGARSDGERRDAGTPAAPGEHGLRSDARSSRVAFFAAWMFFFASGGRDATAGARAPRCCSSSSACVFAAYFLWCWLRGGQTLAMKAWRIRLVDVTPRKALCALRCSPRCSCQRWCRSSGRLFDRDRQFLHDRSRERAWSSPSGARPTTSSAAPRQGTRRSARRGGRDGGQFCSRPMCENRLFSMWKKMPSMMPRNTFTPTMPARAVHVGEGQRERHHHQRGQRIEQLLPQRDLVALGLLPVAREVLDVLVQRPGRHALGLDDQRVEHVGAHAPSAIRAPRSRTVRGPSGVNCVLHHVEQHATGRGRGTRRAARRSSGAGGSRRRTRRCARPASELAWRASRTLMNEPSSLNHRPDCEVLADERAHGAQLHLLRGLLRVGRRPTRRARR